MKTTETAMDDNSGSKLETHSRHWTQKETRNSTI